MLLSNTLKKGGTPGSAQATKSVQNILSRWMVIVKPW